MGMCVANVHFVDRAISQSVSSISAKIMHANYYVFVYTWGYSARVEKIACDLSKHKWIVYFSNIILLMVIVSISMVTVSVMCKNNRKMIKVNT